MRKLFLSTIIVFLCQAALSARAAGGTAEYRESIKYKGEERTYLLFIPEKLNESKPLVIVLHGYGGHDGDCCPGMKETAEREGFALCYPQGLADTTGHHCWNVGYPFQKGLKRDDVGFLCHLVRHIQKKYGLDKNNAFLTGMSNGGEMCYLMAYRQPKTFAAIASVAGLTMEWLYKSEDPRGTVPFMEIHGTSDSISAWEGDLTNEGGWGEYISVPSAVGIMIAQNRCTFEEKTVLPLKEKGANVVTLHHYKGGIPAWKDGPQSDVLLYEIDGGEHSWGFGDMDTCQAIWDFFKEYLR